jgi:hypothetical protein
LVDLLVEVAAADVALMGEEQVAAQRVQALALVELPSYASAEFFVGDVYLGYAGFFTLVDDNRWTYQKAEKWLCTAVSQALLKPPQRQKRSAPSPRK